MLFIWLGMRDSNPRSWDQNPVPYRLANPQCLYELIFMLVSEVDCNKIATELPEGCVLA